MSDLRSIGMRLTLLRSQKQLSLRELASLAKIDKNTILRIEKGLPVRNRSLESVCAALGTTVNRQLLPIGEPNAKFNVSRAAHRRWEPDPLLAHEEDLDRLSDASYRWPLGWSSLHAGFNGFLDCELFGGSIVASVIELFETSTLRSFSGEELLYCLRGAMRLIVADEETLLEVGDSVTLWAAEPHRAGPALPVGEGEAPPLLLSVRVGQRSAARK